MDIRFIGHATFELTEGDTRILIDPFLKGNNPVATVGADEVDPTHVFLTHGHADHVADAVPVAKRTGAQCVAIVELAGWLNENGVDNTADPNLGGTVEFDGGWVRLVPAWHTSTTPDGKTVNTPAGLVINLGGKTISHRGAPAFFSARQLGSGGDDMDGALMCTGGHYTMAPTAAAAAAELMGGKQVTPSHYNPFPPIEQDDQ